MMDGGFEMAICRGCGAEVEWIKTPSGRNMPVDMEYIELDPAGIPHDTVITDDGRVVKGFKIVDNSGLFPIEGTIRGRMPHWATCPKQTQFR